jgi:hypothetical protein
VFRQIVIVIFVFKDMQWKFAGWGNRVFDFCGTICKKSGRRGAERRSWQELPCHRANRHLTIKNGTDGTAHIWFSRGTQQWTAMRF